MGGVAATAGTRSPRVAALVLPRTAGHDASTIAAVEDDALHHLPQPIHYQSSPLTRLNILQSSKLQQQHQRNYGSLLRHQQQLLEEAERINMQLDPELADAIADPDGQRRDSGVLVEDPEQPNDVDLGTTATTPTTTPFPASAVTPMPSLVGVDRFVGRMTVSSR